MIRWGKPDPTRYPGLAEAVGSGQWTPHGDLKGIPFVVFDTETTGFHPYGGDEIISLAACRVGTGEEFNALVNPNRPLPQEITDLTGIRPEDLIGASDIHAVIERFFRFAGRSVLVAHCVDFDRAFLEAKLRRAGRLRWTHPVLDTMVLARGLFPHWGDYRLEHCATRLQTPLEGRHTALGDARTTTRIVEVLLQECSRRGLTTWNDLMLFLHNRMLW